MTKGRTTTKNLVLAPNLASKTFGAVSVSGDAGAAMDDTEASSWKTTKGGKAVIKLAKESVVEHGAGQRLHQQPLRGSESFTLQTSTDGVSWKTQDVGGTDAFGYQAPRPVVPDLHYKTFTPADADQGGLTSASGPTSRRATRRRTSRSATSRCSAPRPPASTRRPRRRSTRR